MFRVLIVYCHYRLRLLEDRELLTLYSSVHEQDPFNSASTYERTPNEKM